MIDRIFDLIGERPDGIVEVGFQCRRTEVPALRAVPSALFQPAVCLSGQHRLQRQRARADGGHERELTARPG